MALFRLIVIMIIVYMIYRLLVRYIIPFLFKAYIKKSQDKFYQQNPNLRKDPLKKKGEVSVDFIPEKRNRKSDVNEDDYIDYEEIN